MGNPNKRIVEITEPFDIEGAKAEAAKQYPDKSDDDLDAMLTDYLSKQYDVDGSAWARDLEAGNWFGKRKLKPNEAREVINIVLSTPGKIGGDDAPPDAVIQKIMPYVQQDSMFQRNMGSEARMPGGLGYTAEPTDMEKMAALEGSPYTGTAGGVASFLNKATESVQGWALYGLGGYLLGRGLGYRGGGKGLLEGGLSNPARAVKDKMGATARGARSAGKVAAGEAVAGEVSNAASEIPMKVVTPAGAKGVSTGVSKVAGEATKGVSTGIDIGGKQYTVEQASRMLKRFKKDKIDPEIIQTIETKIKNAVVGPSQGQGGFVTPQGLKTIGNLLMAAFAAHEASKRGGQIYGEYEAEKATGVPATPLVPYYNPETGQMESGSALTLEDLQPMMMGLPVTDAVNLTLRLLKQREAGAGQPMTAPRQGGW